MGRKQIKPDRGRKGPDGTKEGLAAPLRRIAAAARRIQRPRIFKRVRFSHRAQRAATVLTGLVLTVGCCLLAERYAVGGPEAVQTGAQPAECMSVLILDYHQVLPTEEDLEKARKAGETGILLSDFKEDLNWLTQQGVNFVLPSDLKLASQGIYELPEKAVMLTFDGGYESFYTVVWPQLREQGAKGAVGVLGAEADLYSGSVEKEIDSSRLSWNQIAQMDRSEAVEIASMGYSLTEDLADWKKAPPKGQLSSFLSFLGFGNGDGKILSDEGIKFYQDSLPQDLMTMDEKLRETLYHETDAYLVPAGCEGEETDGVLNQYGIAVSLCEGVPAAEAETLWNVIEGRDSLYELTRIARGEEGSLQEMLEGCFG